ncbi:EamA family transporter [Chloroflexota bacterium]
MLGAILGLGSAAAFGINPIIVRRGTLRVSSRYVAAVSIFTGPLFFLLVAGLNGEIAGIAQFPWQAYVFFALAGIIHFTLGRNCGFRAIQLIGSTRSSTITSFSFVVSITLAIIVLKETITPLGLLGILFAFAGPLLIAMREPVVASNAASDRIKLDRRTLYKGIFYAIGAAIFWGSSSILIKLGLQTGATPLVGSFIAYLAASIVISPSVWLSREYRREMLSADGRSLRLALLSGLALNVAQMLRYLALVFTSVIVLGFMGQTRPLWVLLFSFIFNRRLESFSRWVLLGTALMVMGIILVMIP